MARGKKMVKVPASKAGKRARKAAEAMEDKKRGRK